MGIGRMNTYVKGALVAVAAAVAPQLTKTDTPASVNNAVSYPTPSIVYVMQTVPPTTQVPTWYRNGASGPQVEIIQYRLQQFGYPITVDGRFGDKTEEAVKQFQRDHHLLPDGIVGPVTYSALGFTPEQTTTITTTKDNP